VNTTMSEDENIIPECLEGRSGGTPLRKDCLFNTGQSFGFRHEAGPVPSSIPE
jgi:hypothetical protein